MDNNNAQNRGGDVGDPKSPADGGVFLKYAISAVKWRVKLVDAGGAACLLLAGFVFGLLAMVLCDHFLGGLSQTSRQVGRFVLLACLSAGVVWMMLARVVRRISDIYAARLVEKSNPVLRNDLTAWVEFSDRRGASTEVVSSIGRRAAAIVGDEQFESAVATGRLIRCAIGLAAVAAIFFCYWAMSPKSVWASVVRSLGAGEVPVPTSVQIVKYSPLDGSEVLADRQVEFVALIRHPAGQATVLISRDGGKSFSSDDRLAMVPSGVQPDGTEQFRAAWTPLSTSDIVYQIVCGDASTPPTRLVVINVPSVRRIEHVVNWPGYAARTASTFQGGMVLALPESRIQLRVEATMPIEKADVFVEEDGGRKWSSSVRVNAEEMTAGFVVSRSGRYKLVMTARDHRAVGQSIWYAIQVDNDLPPAIDMKSPSSGLVELCLDEELLLLAEVSDDTGLSACRLACVNQLVGGNGATGRRAEISLADFEPTGPKVFAIDMKIPVSSIGQVGDNMLCRIEACDFSPTPTSRLAEWDVKGNVAAGREFLLIIKPASGKTQPQTPSQQNGDNLQNDESAKSGDDQDSPSGQSSEGSRKPGENSAEQSQSSDGGDVGAARELIEMAGQDSAAIDAISKRLGQSGDQADSQQPTGQNQAQGRAGKESGDKGDANQGQPPGQGGAKGNNGQAGQDGAAGQSLSAGQGQATGQDGSSSQGNSAGQGNIAGQGDSTGQGSSSGQGDTGQRENATGGSSETRGHVDRPTMDGQLTSGELSRLQSIGRIMNEASARIRDDNVDPQLLRELGMTGQQFSAFVEKYSRKLSLVSGVINSSSGGAATVENKFNVAGDSALGQGRDVDGGVSNVAGTATAGSDGQKGMQDASEVKVSSEYQRQVEDYFQAVSGGSGGAPTSVPAK